MCTGGELAAGVPVAGLSKYPGNVRRSSYLQEKTRLDGSWRNAERVERLGVHLYAYLASTNRHHERARVRSRIACHDDHALIRQ